MTPIDKTLLLKTVGTNIKRLRKEKNVEVKEFAGKLKVTPQAVGNIENGKVDLNLSRIVDIANLLQVSLVAILDVSNGDIMTYHSYNNSGGYHVQKVDVIKINEDDAKSNFMNEFKKLANSLMGSIKSK
jgi:transcriptional regulator with XRE-family HTH domain